MFTCPTCAIPLEKSLTPSGLLWHCPGCDGRAATVAMLRKHMPAPVVNELWQSARAGDFPRHRVCPACDNPMAEVPAGAAGDRNHLDVCTFCHLVWFDPGEYRALPARPADPAPPPPTPPLSPEAREKLARLNLARLRERQQAADSGDDGPAAWWHWLPGLLGLPVERDVRMPVRTPVVTWLLALLIIAVGAATFPDLESAVKRFGLIPAEYGRYGGFTFVSSFFLHGGLFHLIGNLYFLLLFGDNVEDWLGRWKFLLLTACAAAAGAGLHILADPRSAIPMVGASGGLAGIVAYYALAFPQAKLAILLRFFFRVRWIHIPVWSFFLVWLALQFLGAWQQLAGIGRVSALAHLGGAAVGFVFWLAFESSSRPE